MWHTTTTYILLVYCSVVLITRNCVTTWCRWCMMIVSWTTTTCHLSSTAYCTFHWFLLLMLPAKLHTDIIIIIITIINDNEHYRYCFLLLSFTASKQCTGKWLSFTYLLTYLTNFKVMCRKRYTTKSLADLPMPILTSLQQLSAAFW